MPTSDARPQGLKTRTLAANSGSLRCGHPDMPQSARGDQGPKETWLKFS